MWYVCRSSQRNTTHPTLVSMTPRIDHFLLVPSYSTQMLFRSSDSLYHRVHGVSTMTASHNAPGHYTYIHVLWPEGLMHDRVHGHQTQQCKRTKPLTSEPDINALQPGLHHLYKFKRNMVDRWAIGPGATRCSGWGNQRKTKTGTRLV